MTTQKYLAAAQYTYQRLAATLQLRGLQPLVSRCLLTESAQQHTWLFVALDEQRIPRLEAYTSSDLLHHLSTVLKRPVLLSNSDGLRYAVMLARGRQLAERVSFPGWRKGLVQLGLDAQGREIAVSWEELGHVMLAGMTGSGKSNALRLLAYQAIQEGCRLLIADFRGRTFAMLDGHPALLARPGDSPEECAAIVNQALAVMDERVALFRACPGAPETLDEYNQAHPANPLPRLVVVINEYNSLVLTNGGPHGELTRAVATLTAQGRGYGINVTLAAQRFQKELVGAAQDQCRSKIAFQVESPSTSRVVLGQAGAESLRIPGRALSRPWGLMQVYGLPKEMLAQPGGSGLSADEQKLVQRLLQEFDGRMTYEALGQLGYSRRQAERLRDDWARRGLAVQRTDQDNALCVAENFVQTGLTGQTVQAVQTGLHTHQ